MSRIYLIAACICLVATILCFKANEPNRNAINAAMVKKGLLTPERMWPYYDADYLNEFIKTANQEQALGVSAMALYIRPTLLWIDVGFAIFCASFAALFWLGIANVLPNHLPVVNHLMAFLIAMSVVYGITDVAEDLWLVKLFSQDHQVTKIEGFAACALTETKIVTISVSVVGGLLFKALDATFSKPTAGDQMPAKGS
ncbi:hypothetical protein [Bradyrhizobium genosp. A]|uniref:hypothetical protein n=1 Tax=Bradyrhizobium genosp. A TaxID=83626 RepID=UPI003CF3CEB0